MRTLILALVSGMLLAGCGKSGSPYEPKSRPTYGLTIGTRTVHLIVHDHSKAIQDDLVSHIKPLWDELETGDSVTFQYQAMAPCNIGEGLETTMKVEYGDGVTVTSTIRSPAWRFFKNRKGGNGLEQLVEGAEPDVLYCAQRADWKILERYIRENVFSMARLSIINASQEQ